MGRSLHSLSLRLSNRRRPWGLLFLGLLGLSLTAFLLAPWSMQEKTLAALHGLCAQRPSHSFWFGELRLPFDARMTGIYGGFFVSQFYLLARGRLRVSGLPSLPMLATLCFFVVIMGVDGVNSTLIDMGLPSLYEPSNVLRYATGALTGTTLGILLWLLASNVLWRRSVRDLSPALSGWSELAQILGFCAFFGFVVMSGWTLLYRPIAMVLTISAVTVLFTLALAGIQIIRRRENSASDSGDLAGPAIGALATAMVFMFVIGGGRFLLEASLNLQPLP